MRLDEALAKLTYALAVATDEQAAALRTCLRNGAGLIPLPAGAEMMAPAGLVSDRREAWYACVDALRIETVGVDAEWQDAAEWEPVHSGDWESVLATLLIERQWDQIEQTARELREKYPEEPAHWQDTVRQAVDLLAATRDTFRSKQVQHARQLLEELLARG